MRRSLSALVETAGLSSKVVAGKLGVTTAAFSQKLQGLRRLSLREVRVLLRALNDVFRAQGRSAVAFEDIDFPEERLARQRGAKAPKKAGR